MVFWYGHGCLHCRESMLFEAIVQEHPVSSLQGKYFPLAVEPNPEELAALNVEGSMNYPTMRA
jgi:hypothetical protein